MRTFTKEWLYFIYTVQKPTPVAKSAGLLFDLQKGRLKSQWLLLLCTAFIQAGAQTALTAKPKVLYDNAVAASGAGAPRRLSITNSSSAAVIINNITLTGKDSSQFQIGSLPQLPLTVNPNDSFALTVAFAPASKGLKTTRLSITGTDSLNSLSVPLRGLGTAGVGGTNEPSLQALLNLYEINISAGDDDPSTNIINSNTASQKAALLGDEMAMQQFIKAGTGNVTIEPLAVFGPTQNDPVVAMGWYTSGNRNSRQELFTVSNSPAANAQTVQVAFSGSTVFDPGTAAFGFFSQWPYFQNRLLYSEDSLNSFTGAVPHHVRVYPYIKGGVREADAYVVAFEEHTSGFDYQDLMFVVRNVRPATSNTAIRLQPKADAFVNKSSAGTNYGLDTTLQVQASASTARNAYISFPLQSVNDVRSATLRLYGRNRTSTRAVPLQVKGVAQTDWSENIINFSNAPQAETTIGVLTVGGTAQYYDLDVTTFVQARFAKGRSADFLVTDTAALQQLISFNSREHGANPPQLLVSTSALVPAGNAVLFVENLDHFPANDRFVASRLQRRTTRDTVAPFRYNSNHDTARVRIHNQGISPLVIKGTELSPTNNWKYLKWNTAAFDAVAFPIIIYPGKFVDLTLQFVHNDPITNTDIKQFIDTLVILSNDAEAPRKLLQLRGLWQRSGEGNNEPTAQQTINAFGFGTKVGFNNKDPDQGKVSKPKGNEILSSYFVRADSLKPVTVRQMSAYHGCCTQKESFRWYPKVSTRSEVKVTTVFTHIGNDAQSLLPRRSLTSGAPAEGSFSTADVFGFRVYNDYSDTLFNPQQKIGIRIWKAIDPAGNLIPDTYIVANDYLGGDYTNYDYNDNMYYVTNIRPELGAAYNALLRPTPSAIDFGENGTGTLTSFALKLTSTGKTYADGSKDPDITIKSVVVTGENRSEFSVGAPSKTLLQPQDSTTITVNFKPVSEGLKIADLLLYYNNSRSPLRVPLYGIAKDSGTTVNLHYRIKSGSENAVVVNGKAWASETGYAFDNLEFYANPQVKEIEATDDDGLYFLEQSSNGDKKPFRYVLPLDSGSYAVRLHFSEVYFGTPGKGLSGGAGSRVMGVTMENEVKIANLDIVKEAGVAAALVRNVPVKVTDGNLNMSFTASVNRPSLSAVEVYSFTRTTPVPPPPVDTIIVTPPPTDTIIVTPPPTDTVIVTPPPPTDTTIINPPPPTDTTIINPPPPTDTVIVTPPPTDTVIVTPPPPPVDTVVVTPPVDTVIVTPPPPVDTVVVTPPVDTIIVTPPPPPTDTIIVTPPPPTDTIIVTPPPPTDTVIVTPPPPPVDTVVVTPPVDTVIVTPPPPVDTVVVPPPPVDTIIVTPPPPPTDTVVVTPPPPDTTVTPPPVRLLVYPNPNVGRFTLLFSLTRRQTVRLLVTDILGRRYGEERFSADAGNNQKEIDITRLRLKPGLYHLELYYEEKTRDVLKVILE